MKEDMMKCIVESIAMLEEIPVTDTRDCWKKVQIHDRLAAVHNALSAAEIIEKKEDPDGNDQTIDK
jgi:hypothetical protein